MIRWIKDRADRLANPLLVKEMYQSVHSRKFLAALWLLLGGALFTYVMVYVSGSHTGECGGHMFVVFGILTYVMALCILPYLGFSNLYQEVKGRTIELVHITAISSSRQVRGRLLASLVKVGLLYAVVGPFAVAAFLFKGVGIEMIGFVLALILIFSVPACALAIWFGALTSSKHVRTIARWGYVLVVIGTLFYGLGFAQAVTFGFSMGGGPDLEGMLVALGASALISLLVAWFLCASAANVLTFEADKCSGKTKLVLLLTVAAGYATPIVIDLLIGAAIDEEVIVVLGFLASNIAALWCIFWAADRRRVARSLERRLERRGLLYRLGLFPFVDGPGSGLAYTALAFGVILAGTAALVWRDNWDWQLTYLVPPLMGFVYVLFFMALTRIVVRLLPVRWRTALTRRVTAVALVIVNLLVSALVLAGTPSRAWWDEAGHNPLFALSPLLYMRAAGEPLLDDYNPAYLLPLLLPLTVGLGVCLVVGIRHFGRYMRGDYD